MNWDWLTKLPTIEAISSWVGQMSRRNTSLPFWSWPIGSPIGSQSTVPAMA